jgi:CRP-like cAMP-binding protein
METRDTLSHVNFFRGADAADLDAVAAIAEPAQYAAGERIVDHAAQADAFFIVVLGTVDVTAAGKEFAVTTMGSGQALGVFAFFERGQHDWSASTREATRLLKIPFDAFTRLLDARPGLALVFYRNVAGFFAHHMRQLAADRDRPYV